MRRGDSDPRTGEVIADAAALATPLRGAADRIVEAVGSRRFVALGEASHGTHEFYSFRAEVTRRLIRERDFTWIGVEGDWPDCWRLNTWVRGLTDEGLDARQVLAGFDRWPTWMWANADVADFLDWLHQHNRSLPVERRVGFYGLDVYSLWDSLARIMEWLSEHEPDALGAAHNAWQCFSPFDKDPQKYAWASRMVPVSCEPEVVGLLAEVLRRSVTDGDAAFDAMQNAAVVVGAERYYRAMVRTDRGSWNIRDTHMADTVDRLTRHLGPDSKGVIWAHNTHVGDARGTSMLTEGLVNIGQLLRERQGADEVFLIGFAAHRGSVMAARQWGDTEQVMPLPDALPGSHEDVLHRAVGEPAVLVCPSDPRRPWARWRAGHRAVGVVYDPARERGNYVPTVMGLRYDALVWFEETRSLVPLHHERRPDEAEFETEPSGF